MAIYLKEKPKSVKDLIIKMLCNRCIINTQLPNSNVYQYSYYCSSFTFKEPELKTFQCQKSYRSFDDLLECCQTYFKSTTAKKLIKTLLTINIKEKNIIFYPQFGFCGGMQRIRIIFMSNSDNSIHLIKYNFNLKGSQSKYTWKELFQMLNLTSIKEVKDYASKNSKTINKL